MKKSIFLFFAAILCAMSAGAAQVTPNGKYFYFKTSSTWNVDNPRYAVYFAWRNGGAEDKTWVSCQTVPGTTDILYVTAPGEFWDIYFCRMNGSTTDNKDANVWNKTDKLQYDGSKNFWTKSTGWNGTTTYSTYVPAISSVTLSDNGTSIISGTGTQADPYLVYVETTIKVKGEGTKVLEDPDAKLNYKFKQGTTSKQEGTSATYQFTASATADTEYTINLDGYTKVNTTKSTVTKSATALYYKTVERAEETNTVTISYKCGDKDVQTGITEVVGVSTTSSFTAPTNITGYKFTNWTIGAGITLKTGAATDATIGVVTKSASSDYTLVANYEEVLETVYFINTIKWARVNIHKWNGKAAASSWPGEKLTASGEKIGEYDVYSYTAKEGDYANIIFNSKTSGTDGGNAQTADLTWTAGEYYIYNYNGNSGWYTKEDAEALLVAPVVEETVYFVNNKKWTKVQAYAWNATGNNGWPGATLTTTGEKVAGFDVYSYTAPQGYANVIFNNKTGDSGEQSADFVWNNGKYYYMDATANYEGGTAEEVATALAAPVVTYDYYVIGTINNWGLKDAAYGMTDDDADGVYEKVITLADGKNQLKINKGEWKDGEIWGYDQLAVEYEGVSRGTNSDDNNIIIDITPGKDITVKFDKNTSKVTLAGLTEKEVVKYDYYIAGTLPGAAWNPTSLGMTKEGDAYKATFTELNAGIYEFKITAGDWDHQWNYNNLGAAYEEVSQGVDGEGKPNGNIKIVTEEAKNITVIFDATAGKITFEGLTPYVAPLTYTVTVPAGTEKCYIAGAFAQSNWNTFVEMDKVDGEDKFTITIVGAKETDEYKYACQADWAYAEVIEGGGNRTKWSALDEVTAWNAPAEPTEVKCYLMGNGDWVNGVEMTLNPDNDNEYMLLDHYISAPFKFKLGNDWSDQVENYDFPGIKWENDNIELPEGIYDFYFKKDTKKAYIAAVYLRDVTNTWGTICLPHASTSFSGAKFYEVSSLDPTKGLWLDEIEAGTQLVAGKPYVFEATASTIKVTYTDAPVAAPVAGAKGLTGTFTDIAAAAGSVLVGNYIIAQNAVHVATASNDLPAYRAYIANTVPTTEQPQLPGRRRVCMGENAATGLDQIVAPAGQVVKVIENGQLIIIRDGVKYNVQGQKL